MSAAGAVVSADSAAAVAAVLRDLPLVADVRVALVDGEACVLLVPSKAGRARLRGYGWRTLADDLEAAIAPVRARSWRFVESVERAMAAAHCDAPAGGRDVDAAPAALVPGDDATIRRAALAPLPTGPELVSTHRESPTAVTLQLRVPLDIAVCREHFPRAPIVPGVVQLGWADAYARERLPVEGRFVALEVVKFHHVVQPGDVVELRLEWLAAERRLKIHGTTHHGRVLSGRMVYDAA